MRTSLFGVIGSSDSDANKLNAFISTSVKRPVHFSANPFVSCSMAVPEARASSQYCFRFIFARMKYCLFFVFVLYPTTFPICRVPTVICSRLRFRFFSGFFLVCGCDLYQETQSYDHLTSSSSTATALLPFISISPETSVWRTSKHISDKVFLYSVY